MCSAPAPELRQGQRGGNNLRTAIVVQCLSLVLLQVYDLLRAATWVADWGQNYQDTSAFSDWGLVDKYDPVLAVFGAEAPKGRSRLDPLQANNPLTILHQKQIIVLLASCIASTKELECNC